MRKPGSSQQSPFVEQAKKATAGRDGTPTADAMTAAAPSRSPYQSTDSHTQAPAPLHYSQVSPLVSMHPLVANRKVALLGFRASGKSSIVNVFVNNSFSDV
jgi:hypothetical protein